MDKTFCCYVIIDDKFDERFASFQDLVSSNLLYYNQLPTIDIMKDTCVGDIHRIRSEIYRGYPLMKEPCPRGGMRCCGSCIDNCFNRCAMDCYNKVSQVLLHGMTANKTLDRDKIRWDVSVVKEAYSVLSNPHTTYRQLVVTVNDIISHRSNPKVKEVLSYYDAHTVRHANHPYNYDYSPRERTWTNPKTGKVRRVVDDAGYIQFVDYPDSGLCAYCLPKTTIDRSRMTKLQRSNLGISSLEKT